ncbi:nucleotidyltransferase family protein [Lacrimispora sp.]|uniref:nucleotidyltransferase family protein n=1 Tax=Lacrimispora sp. TaxID=2719234 RepID=UPI0032E4FFC0
MIKGYEERYLIILLSAVMNQKPSPEPIRSLDWEKMFRLADYHGVAHAVHYGVLGLEQEIPQTVRQQFFDKYLESVYRVGRLQKSESQLLALMEYEKINCFYLSYSDIVKNYPIEEMCCCESIQIGSSRKGTRMIWDILIKVDFEERKTDETGKLYYRIPGIRVLNFDYKLFFSASMRRYFKSLLKLSRLQIRNSYVRELPLDDRYLFLMCRLTDSYARGNISLSQIMDFWIFYKTYSESFNWPYIYGKLKKLKIAEFAERLEHLILRWFGTGAVIENVEIYEAMESYILSKGTDGREISSKLLPLIKTVADCYARNRKLEEMRKMFDWLFPDPKYMETIYPLLGKARVLLPVFWALRLWRYLSRLCTNPLRHKIYPKFKKLYQKGINMIPFVSKKYNIENKDEESKETAEIPK